MAYTTTWIGNGCIVDLHDEITGEEFAAINDELCGSPRLDEVRFFVRDLTRVSMARVDGAVLEVAAFINAVASSYKWRLKGAFVVAGHEVRDHILRYLEQSRIAGCTWDQQIFCCRETALAWASSNADHGEDEWSPDHGHGQALQQHWSGRLAHV